MLVLTEGDVVPRQFLAQRLVEHRIAIAQLHAKPNVWNSADGGPLRLFQLANDGSHGLSSETPDRIELDHKVSYNKKSYSQWELACPKSAFARKATLPRAARASSKTA